MMPVSRAPLATATSAITLNSTGGTIPAARTTCSRGAEDSASSAVGTA